MVDHQPMRKTMSAMSMIILSRPTTAPVVKDVNQSLLAFSSMLVISSTPACSMVLSIRLGSDVPAWATSAFA